MSFSATALGVYYHIKPGRLPREAIDLFDLAICGTSYYGADEWVIPSPNLSFARQTDLNSTASNTIALNSCPTCTTSPIGAFLMLPMRWVFIVSLLTTATVPNMHQNFSYLQSNDCSQMYSHQYQTGTFRLFLIGFQLLTYHFSALFVI